MIFTRKQRFWSVSRVPTVAFKLLFWGNKAVSGVLLGSNGSVSGYFVVTKEVVFGVNKESVCLGDKNVSA